LILLAVAVPAKKRAGAIRLKGQFRDRRSALGAGPVALVHLTVARILIVHLLLFTQIFLKRA